MSVAVILGVGPGLGAAVAHRFAREGYTIVLMARTQGFIRALAQDIANKGGHVTIITCDAGHPGAVAQAMDHVTHQIGPPEVFIYNAAKLLRGSYEEVPPDLFEEAWRVNCFGAFIACQRLLPSMVRNHRGTILFTGAASSKLGKANLSGFASGKFGLRALAQSLAQEVGPEGVHVAHVVVDGEILSEGKKVSQPEKPDYAYLHPEAIAEQYWQLHLQDHTAWTLELDLRPAVSFKG